MGPRAAAALLLVLVAAAWLHAGALRAPFFADDYLFLEQVRGESLPGALSAPDPIGNFLRPVGRGLYFWAITAVAGESPLAFHLAGLALFLVCLALLFVVARRLAGLTAAAFAAGFVALHYAADVPVLWVSGSQDLLAAALALAALALHLRGRRWAAAAALLLALLSKEVVAPAAAVAILADRRPGESWRATLGRGLPLIAATVAWAVLWAATSPLRPAASSVLALDAAAFPAAVVHLAQVALGLEFPHGGPALLLRGATWAAPLLLALLALFLARPGRGGPEAPPAPRRHAVAVGLGWAALGALPVALVAPIWSAYFYLFALCGVGLALGAACARLPRGWALAGLAVLGLASAHARALDEFATARGPWTWQSHVNRFYLTRAMTQVQRYLADLRAARPTLPPRSTLFFANIPQSLGWQAGDGPLVRWAYADTSLRSHYVTAFDLAKARRGPIFFFAVEDGRLRDRSDAPGLLADLGYNLMLDDQAPAAAAAFTLALERDPADSLSLRALAWTLWAQGDRDRAAGRLATLGPGEEPLAPTPHAGRAAEWLEGDATRRRGVVEAYALRALAPDDPASWRLWASAQLAERHLAAAARSLDRYFALGGEQAARDAEARSVRESLRRVLPGGDLAQEDLRRP